MMFSDFEKIFSTFSKKVRIYKLTKIYNIKIKEKYSIIKPWPLRVIEKTIKEEFKIRYTSIYIECK
jgi:acyl-ACP thioesterase